MRRNGQITSLKSAALILSICISGFFALDCRKDKSGPEKSVPEKIFNPTPADGETGVSISPVLSWDEVSGQFRYYVYIDKTNPPSTLETWFYNTTFSHPAPLRYNTTYYWRVETKIDNVTAGRSATWSFTTESEPPREGSWSAMSLEDAPCARTGHSCVWTGSRVVVWGGEGANGSILNDGGIYDPLTDSWAPMSLDNAPCRRCGHSAVWTGEYVIIWGGRSEYGSSEYFLDNGGIYDLENDAWYAVSSENPPQGKYRHSSLWTGSEMIVWGGYQYHVDNCTDWKYNLENDSWVQITHFSRGYWEDTAIWTGSKMIDWGGHTSLYGSSSNGRVYDPVTGSLGQIRSSPLKGRGEHSAVWTGSEMILWSGYFSDDCFRYWYYNDGARYDPEGDAWTAITTAHAPSARKNHFACYADGKMVILGGRDAGGALKTGGVYYPDTDTWMATSTENAPSGVNSRNAVLAGEKVIVFGGTPGTSGIFEP
jgi:hypothetical protein